MKKYFNYFVIFLSLNFLFCTKVLSADCADVNGATATISSDCSGRLGVTGDSSNITINSGVTISGQTSNDRYAIETTNGTNTIITNNGNIGPTNLARYGIFHNTGSGTITKIDNKGTIEVNETGSGGVGTAIFNKSTIDLIENSGTIKSNTRNAIANGSGGVINKIDNTGTIWSVQRWTIKNITGTITTITNSGTIKTNDEAAIRNYGGTISTINNSGTISAKDNTIQNLEESTITEIINSNTITSSGGKKKTIRNEGTITSLNNSGTISATYNSNNYGSIHNFSTGTITTITNSGTISSTASYGIENLGTITTITNTGEITGGSGTGDVDIKNISGIITTLNNSQAASSSALTYDGKLPTYYNVIVNDTDDYGKTTFSDVSGTTNFGVHSTSTLSESTTYSSVLSGLSSSDIASGTSGTFVSGPTSNDWILSNSSGTLWDLVVAADQDITPDTITSVTTSVKPNVILGINNLTSVTEVNFANMNTYDCDLFDKNNICLSLGSRYTSINTPKTETNSAVMVGGYKLSDTLRVAAFYHSNLSHKTPASFKLSDKTPMTGGLIVWNQNADKLGYQLKLANAYQQKNATLTREVVGSSEEGKGQTVIEAESYVAELQYGYKFSDDTVLHPYFAARSAVIKQDAYTETGISSPLSFNEIKDKSTTVLLGLKFNTRLSHNLSLKGSLGVEHDIEHSVDKLAPTGISGLSTVSLTDGFNKTRPVVSLGFDYALKPNHRLSGILQYQELPYESKTESNAYLYYTIGF